MSAPMVRAILAGTKTQTRRPIKPQPYVDEQGNACWNGSNYGQDSRGTPLFKSLASPLPGSKTKRVACPYGRPGDRLWVREAFYCDNAFYPHGVDVNCMWREVDGKRVPIPVEEQRADMLARSMYYRADGDPEFECAEGRTPWRPSIHMPRCASRITLEVTGVRVERLCDISEADALAEGVDMDQMVTMPFSPSVPWATATMKPRSARQAFLYLWESINGPGSWDANPWVWAVSFKRAA